VDPQLIAFLAATFLLAVTPGISAAVVVSNVLQRGRAAGLLAASRPRVHRALHAAMGLVLLLLGWLVLTS
jgi:threonine/homoserine/homoserine lactone efflux protein